MSLRSSSFSILFTTTLLLAAPLAAQAPGIYALTGGTVHPVGSAVIEGGTVVIRGGLIEAVGRNIAVPADAVEVDVRGMHVYPGLFDAQTAMGLPEPAPRVSSFGSDPPAARSPASPEPTASFRAADAFKLATEALETRRATGVTTILVASNAGIFNGQSAILNLYGDDVPSMILKSPVTHQISFNPRSSWTYPDSLMGVNSYIRQTLLDAAQYEAATRIYSRDPSGRRRPSPDTNLEALAPVLRRELPVVFVADTETMIRRAHAIASESQLRWILSGGRQTYRMADEIRNWNVPVLVSVNFPQPPSSADQRNEEPLRVIRDRVLSVTAPAELARRNVPFALVSGKGKPADFIKGIRRAIDGGLSETAALRAVTLSPAEILGADRQIGSIDRGKIANLVVTDGPIFNRNSKVRHVYVDGREIRLPAEDKPAPSTAATTASPVDGGWNLTVRAPEGDVAIQVTFKLQGTELSGTYSGGAGSGDIRNGTVSDNRIQFDITTQTQAETFDWSFNGTISDNRIEGTVTTNLGQFQFTGSKTP
ncbi:MAG TPA: amidohydrolase family protein [Thermoanaerobaculia bacterium]|nr:amidohydrolase family protein [Thermoanaerobaculia bacterium]